MATHTVHGALTQMHFDFNGAPWTFPKWQELTSIRNGLFPEDDALLPPRWTRDAANFIEAYFTQFDRKVTEEEKVAFSVARKNGGEIPGRLLWRNFITEGWKTWHIHAKITEVFFDERIHPLGILLSSRKRSFEMWPHATDYIPLAIDSVGLSLFGEEAMDANGLLEMDLRRTTRALVHRTWCNIRNQVARSRSRIINLEEEATKAFRNLDRDRLTNAKIKAVIVKLARWKALAEILQIPNVMDKVEEMEQELKVLMLEIRPQLQVSNPNTANAALRGSAAAVKSLASESDMEEVVNLYLEFFNTPAAVDSEPLQEQLLTTGVQIGDSNNGADLGVEVESSMSPEALSNNLGFPPNCLPLLFNTFRHKAGLSSWDPVNAALFQPDMAVDNPDMDAIILHWHQLAGVHSQARMCFTAEPQTSRPCGILIADEVGLGKTFQAATMIAFLSDIAMRQKMERPLPPIIASTPYLGKYNVLPRLLHLIIVPGTLLSQWENELKTVFRRGSFDILVYGTGKAVRKAFWAVDGPFHSSKNDVNKIIVASHSALQQDFSSLYMWRKTKSPKLPWNGYSRLPSYASTVDQTLYGRQYLSITIDEAHAFRNVGAKHAAAIVIMQQAVLRIAMTATPLQTSTKDVAGMGRLLGIPHFLSLEALEEERKDISTIRQAKRGSLDNPDSDAEDDPVRACTVTIAQRMQHQFEGRILRRTTASLNWKQVPLITLPPCEDIQVIVKPTPREMEIISELADRVKESVAASNGVLMIVSRSFYIEHRMAIGYARYNLEETIPKFNSLEEWEPKKSTKMDTCARICQHLLSRDDAPAIIVKEGQVNIPTLPPLEQGQPRLQTTKILISQQFPSLSGLLRNVLELYGMKYLSIDGQTSFAQRAKIVKRFSTDPQYRILIMSSVGSVGLNLTAANVIIFLDQPWSSQDELQIRGRAHRQPQEKIVQCYHILADETADIVLSALARGKHHMMTGFLQQDRGKELMDLFSGQNLPNEKDDYDNTDPAYMHEASGSVNVNSASTISTRSKSKYSRKKAKAGDAGDEGENPSKKKAKKGKKAPNQDQAIQESDEQQRKADSDNVNMDACTNTIATTSDLLELENMHNGNENVDINAKEDFLLGSMDNTIDSMSSGRELEAEQDDFDYTEPDAAVSSPCDLFGYSYTNAPSTPPRTQPQAGDRRDRFHTPDSPNDLLQKKRMRVDLVDYSSSPAYLDSLDDNAAMSPELLPKPVYGQMLMSFTQKENSPTTSALPLRTVSTPNLPQLSWMRPSKVSRIQPSLAVSRSSESLGRLSTHIQSSHGLSTLQPTALSLFSNGKGSLRARNHSLCTPSASASQAGGSSLLSNHGDSLLQHNALPSTSHSSSASTSASTSRSQKQPRSALSLPALRQPTILFRESDVDRGLSPPPPLTKSKNPFSKSNGKRRAI